MAKKSARSKGYRTYKKEQKGFTKQEIRTMIIGFAVIVVIFLGVVFVPDWIEGMSLLKVKDGAIVGAEENWLIRNISDTSKDKYRKIAEINPAEGYALREVQPGFTDELETMFYFEPTDAENAVANEYFVMSGNGEYDELVNNAHDSISAFAEEVFTLDEVAETEINGVKATYYGVEYSVNSSDDAENPEYTYCQSVYLYLDSDVKNVSIVLSANNEGDSQEVFKDRAAMVELLKDAAANIVIGK